MIFTVAADHLASVAADDAAPGRCDIDRNAAGRRHGIKPDPVYLNAGDTMELWIDGLGTQKQNVVADS